MPSNKTFPGIAQDDDLGPLLDEAKTMLNVGAYHENIVNLQGVTCLIKEGRILEVTNTIIVFIPYVKTSLV